MAARIAGAALLPTVPDAHRIGRAGKCGQQPIHHAGLHAPQLLNAGLTTNPTDQNRWAQSRRPMDMMRHG